MIKKIHLAIAGAALFGAALSQAADLTVKVDGVTSSQGEVRLMLFNEASWPKEPDKQVGVPAMQGSTTVVMRDVTPGDYVFVAYHDVNSNGRLDMDERHLPTEYFAVSKEPTIENAQPPDFDKASVKLGEKGGSFKVKLIMLH